MRRPLVLLLVLITCAALLPTATAEAGVVGLGAYHRAGLTPFAGAGLLSSGTTTPRVDTGVHDAAGVRMVDFGGRLYDHPVAQAQYGLVNVTTYQRTHDVFYLNRAMAQANRLVARRVVSGGAWYFPYRFNYRLHRGTDVEQSPWYSAMAQGLAVALMCRLYAVTHNPAWRTDAGYAFAALTHGPSTTAPWTSRVDSAGYLWLEEYPLLPPARSDRTFNGFMFTLMGVYEYWLTTGSSTAATLFDGGVTTIRHYFPAFRQPAWISHYCLAHPPQVSSTYHGAHERLLLGLYTATHISQLAADSDLLRYDYPSPVSGTVHFAAGVHTGYVFSSTGAVLASRTMRLTRPAEVPSSARNRIYGKGIYYRITAGTMAGYWVSEAPPSRYLEGIVVPHVYRPARVARLAAGSYLGLTLDAAGHVLGTVPAAFTAPATATVSTSAWVNGFPYALVTSGPLAGGWVRMTRAVVLT